MNSVIECLMNHRSVRRYSDKPVEPEILDVILTAGTRAATAHNLQSYTLLVIDDNDTLNSLNGALATPFIERSNCPIAVLGLVDQYRVRRWLHARTGSQVFCQYPYNFFLAMSDTLIALQNIVIAAESLGLGTCYVGSGIEVDVRKLFGVPEYVFPAGLVCMGYPDESPGLSKRLPLEAVVHRNRYHIPSDNEIDCWYRERDQEWSAIPESRKRELAEQGIENIAQYLSVQKFSLENVRRRSRGMRQNLRASGFDLRVDLED
jgi:FMN reductase (NADPH)